MMKGLCQATDLGQCFMFPAVLWHRYFNNQKSLQAVEASAIPEVVLLAVFTLIVGY